MVLLLSDKTKHSIDVDTCPYGLGGFKRQDCGADIARLIRGIHAGWSDAR